MGDRQSFQGCFLPVQADVSTLPVELTTNLGPDEVVLLRAGGDAGRLKKPTTAVVAPLTDFHSPPARVLRSIETCQVLTLWSRFCLLTVTQDSG